MGTSPRVSAYEVVYVFTAGRYDIDRTRIYMPLPEAQSYFNRDGAVDEIKRSHETFDPLRDPTMRPTPFQAYLRIQIGCDKFCTYCIVPSVRGPEQSRSPRDILAESRQLASEGCREIILLGQTVNSYRFRDGEREPIVPVQRRETSVLGRISAVEMATSIRAGAIAITRIPLSASARAASFVSPSSASLANV